MEHVKRAGKSCGQQPAIAARLIEGEGQARIDWPAWLRSIERKRRQLSRISSRPNHWVTPEYFKAATFSSFLLEGINISQAEIDGALTAGAARKVFPSRNAHRLRNHVCILHKIEKSLRLGEPLKADSVVRWYTSISSGLSSAGLNKGTLARLEQIVRRVNSPQFRLQPAIGEVARLHVQLLKDPIVPSFNGILARLLLRYHLGRCGLPGVVFDVADEEGIFCDEARLLRRILEMVERRYSGRLES